VAAASTLAAPGLAQAGTLDGRLIDRAGRQGLAGATALLQGTSRATQTREDGSFAFADLPQGRYRVVVHSSQYQDAIGQVNVPDAGTARIDLEAVAITRRTRQELIVTGNRLERSAALLQIESGNTTSVLTAPMLASSPDENVVSSLSRLPGLTALSGGFPNTNGVQADFAGRGEGNYISVRGLDAEFNTNTIDGVDAAQGEPYSREIQLALLPPSGFQTIVVNKSLTPDMDGDAIGGAVDYRTPTAFDFGKSESLSVEASTRANSRASDYGRNPFGGEIALGGQKKFGANNEFGIYASAYYDIREFSNSIVDGIYPAYVNGMWAFSQQTETGSSVPVSNLAQNLTLTGLNIGLTTGVEKRFGGNISLDWRPSEYRLAYIKLTFARQSVTQASYYSQIYGDDISAAQVHDSAVYAPFIGAVRPRFYYETDPEQALLATYQMGWDARFGRLHLAPNAFISWGYNDEPNHFEISAHQPEVASAYGLGSSILFAVRGKYPSILLPAGELANIGDIATYGARRAGETTDELSSQVKSGIKLDARYDIDTGWFSHIETGVKFENSNRDHSVRDYTTDLLFTTDVNDPTFGSLGILRGSVSALVPGVYPIPAPLISNAKAVALFNSAIASQFGGDVQAASDQCGAIFQNAYNCDTQHGIEQTSSIYLKAVFAAGPLEITAGSRFEHTDIFNTFYALPAGADGAQALGNFQHNQTRYEKLLPSISANFRPDPSHVYRASIWQSYVPPSMFQLGGGAQIANTDGGASEGGTTSITEGNPKLKTIDSINYDISAEWLSGRQGSASAALFFKSLHHFIFDTVGGFTNQATLTEGATVITEPVNGGYGHVFGAELAGRQKLEVLPYPFNGLGMAANLTYERSGVHTLITGLNTTERLLDQPNVSGNLQLFFEINRIEAQLSYRYVGSYVSQYATLGASSQLDTWIRSNRRFDLHLGYQGPWGVHFDFSIANLLDSASYHATIGRHSDEISTTVDSGRTFILRTRLAL
jgi:TonB-dependent receptor